MILILALALAVILGRRANSNKLEKIRTSKEERVYAEVISQGKEKDFIPIEMNEAYGVATRDNIAYTTTEMNDYEEVSYTYI